MSMICEMKKKAALLVLATVLVYGPVLKGEFLWDDKAHVPDRPSVYTLAGLRQIWTSPGYVQQYYPLTFSSVWAAHRLWGDHPRGYHILTLLLHAFNAVLIAVVLTEFGLPGAWAAAFLFALHPVQVESVAWISELKNTQSTFFALLALWCYWRSRKEKSWLYGVSCLLYLSALASKTTACMLPVVIGLMLVYKERRLPRRELFLLAPFVIAGAAFGWATSHWERYLIGAAGPEWNFSFTERVLIAGHAWWFTSANSCGRIRSSFFIPNGRFIRPPSACFYFPLARWRLSADYGFYDDA